METKICFAGAYGVRSLGDDAPLLFLAEGIRKRLGDFEGVVISRHGEEVDDYARYGLRAVQNLEYPNREKGAGLWFRGFNPGDDRAVLDNLVREIRSSDLLVIGAGNALVDISIDLLRGPIPYFSVLTLIAKMHRVPVMLFGVTLGPFRTEYGRSLSRLILDMADRVSLRDSGSVQEALEFGFRESDVVELPDPALGIGPLRPTTSPGKKANFPVASNGPRIGVSVRSIPAGLGMDEADYLKTVAEACDRLIDETNGSVKFVPQCLYSRGRPHEDDRHVAQQVRSHMKAKSQVEIVTKDIDVLDAITLYGGLDVVLGTRLHANVFATIAGTPCVAISYLPKVKAFMEWLGRKDYVIDLDDLSADRLVHLVTNSLARWPEERNLVMDRVAEGRAMVEEYVNLACSLIEPPSI